MALKQDCCGSVHALTVPLLEEGHRENTRRRGGRRLPPLRIRPARFLRNHSSLFRDTPSHENIRIPLPTTYVAIFRVTLRGGQQQHATKDRPIKHRRRERDLIEII